MLAFDCDWLAERGRERWWWGGISWPLRSPAPPLLTLVRLPNSKSRIETTRRSRYRERSNQTKSSRAWTADRRAGGICRTGPTVEMQGEEGNLRWRTGMGTRPGLTIITRMTLSDRREITIPVWCITTAPLFLHLRTDTVSTTVGPLFINMADNKALAWQLLRVRSCSRATWWTRINLIHTNMAFQTTSSTITTRSRTGLPTPARRTPWTPLAVPRRRQLGGSQLTLSSSHQREDQRRWLDLTITRDITLETPSPRPRRHSTSS